jgi:hypothetical protein
MQGSSDNQRNISSSSSSSSSLSVIERDNDGINLLFRLTEEQYESNMINIEEFIRLAERLSQEEDKLEQKQIILGLYNTLMLIPYKYGRQHISKFYQSISENEAWIDSKYIISLGLPSLVEDLENNEREKLHEILNQDLVNEIAEQFVKIGKNMKFYQLKEWVVRKDNRFCKGIVIEENELNDLARAIASRLDLTEEAKEKFLIRFAENNKLLEKNLKELRYLLCFQQTQQNEGSLRDYIRNLVLNSIAITTPDYLKEFNILDNMIKERQSVKIFSFSDPQENKSINNKIEELINFIDTVSPNIFEYIISSIKQRQDVDPLSESNYLTNEEIVKINKEGIERKLIKPEHVKILLKVVKDDKDKEVLLKALSKPNSKGTKGKDKDKEAEAEVEISSKGVTKQERVRILEVMNKVVTEQKEAREFLEDIINFYKLVIHTSLVNLDYHEISEEIIKKARTIIDLRHEVVKDKGLIEYIRLDTLGEAQDKLKSAKDKQEILGRAIDKLKEQLSSKRQELEALGINPAIINLRKEHSRVTRELSKQHNSFANLKEKKAKLEDLLKPIDNINQRLKNKDINGIIEGAEKSLTRCGQEFEKLDKLRSRDVLNKTKIIKIKIDAFNKQKLTENKFIAGVEEQISLIIDVYKNAVSSLQVEGEALNEQIKSSEQALKEIEGKQKQLGMLPEDIYKKYVEFNKEINSLNNSIRGAESEYKKLVEGIQGYTIILRERLEFEDISLKILSKYSGNIEKAREDLAKRKLRLENTLIPQEMHKVRLIELKEYQKQYDKRTIERELRFYKELLELADSNIIIIAAIVEFVNWQKECCGDEVSERLESTWQCTDSSGNIINYLKDLRDFRHKAVHCFDDIKRAQDATSFEKVGDISKVKRCLFSMINQLLEHNLEYLLTGNIRKRNVPTHFMRAVAGYKINKCLPELPAGGRAEVLSEEEQIRLFVASIENGRKLIQLIKDEIEEDEATYTLDQIIEIASRKYKGTNDCAELTVAEKKIKLKYSTLLLALGEVLGNLQRHELLTSIAKLDIKPDEMVKYVAKAIPKVREYRNTLTHHGYHNQKLFKETLELINERSDELLQEVEYLYVKVKNEYNKSKILSIHNLDGIRSESIPLSKEGKDRQCIAQ